MPAAAPKPLSTLRSVAVFAVFVISVLGVGIAIGLMVTPGSWYQRLHKPVFIVPDWIFGPVWAVLYIFIAIAGWRTAMRAPRSLGMALWGAQMGLNWAWSPVFFGLHLMWAGFGVIMALLGVVVLFIRTAWRADRVSALLFCPYALWVGFAALLNVSLGWLN